MKTVKYKVTLTKDNGADYLPQTIKRIVEMGEAENIVTFAIVAGFGYWDAAFIAAEMRDTLTKRTATAWGWSDNLKRVNIRVEKHR